MDTHMALLTKMGRLLFPFFPVRMWISPEKYVNWISKSVSMGRHPQVTPSKPLRLIGFNVVIVVSNIIYKKKPHSFPMKQTQTIHTWNLTMCFSLFPLVIHALRAKSGDLGLSAFLPSPDRKYAPPENTLWSELLHFDTENDDIDTANGLSDDEDSQQMSQEEQLSSSSPSSSSSSSSSPSSPLNDHDLLVEEMEDEPHLPLDNNWRTAKFALKDVLDSYGNGGSVQVRQWIERVMERYRFIIGIHPHSLFFLSLSLSLY